MQPPFRELIRQIRNPRIGIAAACAIATSSDIALALAPYCSKSLRVSKIGQLCNSCHTIIRNIHENFAVHRSFSQRTKPHVTQSASRELPSRRAVAIRTAGGPQGDWGPKRPAVKSAANRIAFWTKWANMSAKEPIDE